MTMDKDQSATFVMGITACPDQDYARKIARLLVRKHAAACVQLFPIESVYRWEGKVTEEPEVLLLIKTTAVLFPKVTELIREMHPYEVPEIIQLPISDGLPAYLDWIRDSTEP